MTPRRALVTGAAGFLGRALVKEMLDRGERVVGFDVDPEVRSVTDIGASAVLGDLARWSDVLDAVSAYDIGRIFHVGALRGTAAEANPTAAYAANADGTRNILEVARTVGIDRVVFASSFESLAIADAAQAEGAGPRTITGVTKAFGELLVDYYHRRYLLDVRAARLPSIVGASSRLDDPASFMADAVRGARDGSPVTVFLAPNVQCELLWIDDAVRALLELDAAPPNGLRSRVYDVGGTKTTVGGVVHAISRAFPEMLAEFAPGPGWAELSPWLDDRSANRDWGWEAQGDVDRLVVNLAGELAEMADGSEL